MLGSASSAAVTNCHRQGGPGGRGLKPHTCVSHRSGCRPHWLLGEEGLFPSLQMAGFSSWPHTVGKGRASPLAFSSKGANPIQGDSALMT